MFFWHFRSVIGTRREKIKEGIHFDIIKLTAIPDLVTSVQFSPPKAERPDELYTFEFKNNFTFLVDIMKEKNEVYNRTINEINYIIDLIDKELNFKN